ncbi:DotU family type IV/VI secretion system protein [Trinickia caryophylli]|uniref:Type VI secretion system protein ImpK n=1 Tax=Trinickia caryophylli TaxID=28094 RepID=A0A1X7D690_TRICW|nr:DotU family type IV/VI secretion system protein [Trinickia caryophylli]WQE14987.1 DotU family type IV/VI secretion system protein [Trinickia caryophylli]GLU31284.1 hypothetical protein Busp01_11260 [Trinickia caryophylli]SMF09132.1 type VI secretion system protein ImpK [Trinickia caryophylli]
MTISEHEGQHTRLPLYRYFCDFYALLVEVKRALANQPAVAQAPPPRALAPSAIHERLREHLRAQEATVRDDGTPEQCDLYGDAQYAMAALADEQLLLELDWAGRADWLNLTLESALFDTRMAGVRFYRVIDRLLAVPTATQGHAELGLVLLGALQAGFRGELRGPDEAARLAERRHQLVRFVRELRGDERGRHAFEQAYEHTLGPTLPEPADRRLAPLSPWFNAARIGGAAYLATAGAIWFVTLHPFHRLVADDPGAQRMRSEHTSQYAEGTILAPGQVSGIGAASFAAASGEQPAGTAGLGAGVPADGGTASPPVLPDGQKEVR